MKRFSITTFGLIALFATVSVMAGKSSIAQNAQKGLVELRLETEKKVVQQLAGKKENWQAMVGQAVVQPLDVLRYTVTAVNNGDRLVKNLKINQPIPKGMVYILNSTSIEANQGSKVTYSIDGGRNFVEKPKVKITLPNGKVETKPAPATAYTHIRWNIDTLVAAAKVKGTYQVQVRP